MRRRFRRPARRSRAAHCCAWDVGFVFLLAIVSAILSAWFLAWLRIGHELTNGKAIQRITRKDPEPRSVNANRIRIERKLSPGKYTGPFTDDKRPTLRDTASRETPAPIGKRTVSRFHAVLIHNVPVIICQVWGTTDEKDSRLAHRSIGRTDFGSGICTRRFGSRRNRTGSQRTGEGQEAPQGAQATRQARRCVGKRIGRRHRRQGSGELNACAARFARFRRRAQPWP